MTANEDATDGVPGRRVVLAVYVGIVAVAGILGAVLGLVDPDGMDPRLFFVVDLPPTALGLAESPGLRVASPRPYDPEDGTAGAAGETVTVAPEFDVLVPAFDWEAPDEEWEPPEPEYRQRPTGSPSGAIGG